MTNEIKCSGTSYVEDNPATTEQELSNAAFGLRLKKLRKEAGISRNDMAELLGMETNSLGLIERGINGMSRKNILLLNQAYNFDLNFLLTGKYVTNEDIDNNALRQKWISIFDTCPTEKLEALTDIVQQIADKLCY